MGTDPNTGIPPHDEHRAASEGQACLPTESDTRVPHSARMYDYWLGGKDNFAIDRAMADLFLQKIPSMREMAKENRCFVTRSTHFLTAQGVSQFLDIGTGIPTSPNLHETAQEVDPNARVVYVDNDPVVLAHARALMVSAPTGQVAYINGDIRRPHELLSVSELAKVLDMSRPVGLMLIAILMLISDEEDPYSAVAALRDAMPSGSYLTLTHPTQDFDPEAVGVVTAAAREAGMAFTPRSHDEVRTFFDDWVLEPPGLVAVKAWRPPAEPENPNSAYYWAGVARKP
jgi:hypothetical protein